ncbi:MAG: CHAT domain-containing tetratricopeptide repeat protein [Acidobacteriota bacterium]
MSFEQLLELNAELDALSPGANPKRRVLLSSIILSYLPKNLGPEQRLVYLAHLGDGFLDLARSAGATEFVNQGLKAYKEAAELCAATGQQQSYAQVLNNVAALLIIRGGAGDFERAVQNCEEALTILQQDTDLKAWAWTQLNRATALSRLADERVEDDQEEAIAVFEEVLAQTDREVLPEAWARAQIGLAAACLRCRCRPLKTNLAQARAACHLALEVLSREGNPDSWAQAHHNLATVESRSPAGTADATERAIAFVRLALEVRQPEQSLRGWMESSLLMASLLAQRSTNVRLGNLDAAITCYRAILRVLEPLQTPELLAEAQTSLSFTLVERAYGESGTAEIEEAIRLGSAACETLEKSTRPAILARAMINLGVAHQKRRTGVPLENLDRATAFLESALDMLSPARMPSEWARAASNLANCWIDRPSGDRVEAQERALSLYRRAQQVRGETPDDVHGWAETEQNLGALFAVRVRGRPSFNIGQAIEHAERALRIYTRRVAPHRWATVTHNLASYHALSPMDRGMHLRRALVLCAEALEVRTRDELPLEWADSMQLHAVVERDLAGGRAAVLRCALATVESTLEVRTEDQSPLAWARSMAVIGEIQALLQENQKARRSLEAALRIETVDVLPRRHVETAAQLGNLHFANGRWGEALEHYRSALEAAEVLYREGASADTKSAQLTELRDVHLRAAACLARLGRLSEAVELLERTRTRISSERLVRRGLLDDPTGTQSEDSRQLREEIEGLEIALRRAEPLGQDEWVELSERLQAARSHLPPLPELDLAELLAAASPGHPILYLVPTPAGSTALVAFTDAAGRQQIEMREIEGLDTYRLARWLAEDDGEGRFVGFIAGQFDSIAHLRERLPGILDGLGDRLAAPIVKWLRELGADRCTLIATGVFALLPLHAARLVDGSGCTRIFGEEIELAQAPSLRWLVAARRVLAASGNRRPRLVGVSDPPGGPRSLPFAEAELEMIAASFGDRRVKLNGAEATTEALERALPNATHVHLACHGSFDMEEPLDTALQLADGPWTLREMLDGRPFVGVRLVTFSACLTAVTDSVRALDERSDLPTACLESGAAGVVATLWQVADLPTFLFMEHFYRELANGRDVSASLARAQRRLRELRADELNQWLKTKLDSTEASALRRVASRVAIEIGLCADDERPYEDPYYWAGFVYIGA